MTEKVHTHHLELVTSSQAAEAIGVSRQTILRLVDSSTLHPTALVGAGKNGSYVFTPAEVERVAALRAKKQETAK